MKDPHILNRTNKNVSQVYGVTEIDPTSRDWTEWLVGQQIESISKDEQDWLKLSLSNGREIHIKYLIISHPRSN